MQIGGLFCFNPLSGKWFRKELITLEELAELCFNPLSGKWFRKEETVNC
jgi:hypothetical protein